MSLIAVCELKQEIGLSIITMSINPNYTDIFIKIKDTATIIRKKYIKYSDLLTSEGWKAAGSMRH